MGPPTKSLRSAENTTKYSNYTATSGKKQQGPREGSSEKYAETYSLKL